MYDGKLSDYLDGIEFACVALGKDEATTNHIKVLFIRIEMELRKDGEENGKTPKM